MLYDVLVVGIGAAGLTAAIEAKERGAKIAIMAKTSPLRSNSSMAAGGINAALSVMQPDSAAEHTADTIKGGDGLCDRRAAQLLCSKGPQAIEFLTSHGVIFDMRDDGRPMQRSFGGGGKKRACYSADKTGAAIVQALLTKARSMGIELIGEHIALSLLHKNGRVCGITALRKSDSQVVVFAAKAIVFAGGGFAGIYKGHTTNPQDSCGDLLAIALRAGLRLQDMEFVQFHPTALAHTGALVSESVRGEGGYLINSEGERFVNELATRDLVSIAIAKELLRGQKVYIDARHLGEELLNKKLPSFRRSAISSEGVDPLTQLVPIKPVAHYTMGGIETDMNASTDIKGLYACGECAATGAHGANRLGGNSLLETVVFGRIAGENATDFAKEHDFCDIDFKEVAKEALRVERILGGENRYNVNAIRKSLGETMFCKAGIFRTESGLYDAFDYLGYLLGLVGGLHCIEKSRNENFELSAILELQNSLLVAEAAVLAMIERKESRGAHNRDDFPRKNDKEYMKHSFIKQISDGFMRVSFAASTPLAKLLERIVKFVKSN